MPDFIKDFLMKSLPAGLTGFKGYIVKMILTYGGEYVWSYVKKFLLLVKRAYTDKQAQEKYDKVEQDPTSTIDERGEAYEEYINKR